VRAGIQIKIGAMQVTDPSHASRTGFCVIAVIRSTLITLFRRVKSIEYESTISDLVRLQRAFSPSITCPTQVSLAQPKMTFKVKSCRKAKSTG